MNASRLGAEQAGGWGLTREELEDARIKFVRLRDEVRAEISPREASAIDADLKAEMERRRSGAAPVTPTPEADPESVGAGKPAESTPPAMGKKKRSKAALPVSLTIGGVGLAGLGVGTGFLVHSLGKKGDAKDLREELDEDGVNCDTPPSGDDRCDRLKDFADSKDLSMNVSTVAFIAGGALVVGATIAYLAWPKTRTVQVGSLKVQELRPAVAVGPGQWQFGLTGSF